MKPAGSVAVITGGASGFGRALAERLVSLGGRVVLGDLQSELGEKVAAELNAGKDTKVAVFQRCDVTSSAQLELLISRALSEWGKLDIMVNNAGYNMPADLFEEQPSNWRLLIDVLFGAVVDGTRLAIRHWKRQQENDGQNVGGVVINTSSTSAFAPGSFMPVYGPCKMAVAHFTASHAALAHSMGIRVTAVAPGFVDTPLVQKQIAESPAALGVIEALGWVQIDKVVDAMMMCIEDETLAGDTLTILPKGIVKKEFVKKAIM